MAKWKLETGQIINSNNGISYENSTGHFHKLSYHLSTNRYAPYQIIGSESDFTILLDDGKTIRATLIKEPKDLMEHWEQNKVEGFILDTRGRELYFLANLNCEVLACIPKSWYLDRQIDALNKLIEIYKD